MYIIPIYRGTRYLPDFKISHEKTELWLEIKGEEPKDSERTKCRLLAEGTGRAVAMFSGLPDDPYPGVIYCWDDDLPGVSRIDCIRVSGDQDRYGVYFRRPNPSTGISYYSTPQRDLIVLVVESDREEHSATYDRAINAAKYARFEHGANPAPPWLR